MNPLEKSGAASSFQAAEPTPRNENLKLLNPPQQTAGGSTTSLPSSLHDIYGPLEPVESPPYLLYTLFGLVPLLIAAALCWWLRKRKQRPALSIPPGVTARSDLMQARELMGEETALQYLEKLSEILRHYIESRFSLTMTRQTTREFLSSLTGSLPANHVLVPFRKELQDCLETCDMAKFAHHPATFPHLRKMEQTILDFINVSEPDKAENGKEGER